MSTIVHKILTRADFLEEAGVTVPTHAGSDDVVSEANDLIIRLDNVLAAIPLSQDEVQIRAEEAQLLLAELGGFGIDGDALLRYALVRKATGPLLVTLLGALETGISVEPWWESLALPHSAMTSDSRHESVNFRAAFENIYAWARQAPISDVLNFRAPGRAQLSQIQLTDQKYFDDGESYVWLYFRAVERDLERWSSGALLLEYRWQNELEPARFPDRVLASEGPDGAILNEQIAYRVATMGGLDISGRSDGEALLWQLQDTAVGFLQKGRSREAAALFEFHCKSNPEDARSINNLGFCKIPWDASSALVLLRRAEKLGFDDKFVNVYNQVCCLVRLNRLGEALDRAESYWQREREEDLGGFPASSGYVWTAVESDPIFAYEEHVLNTLSTLMVSVSQQLNLPARIKVWQSRVEETRPETM